MGEDVVWVDFGILESFMVDVFKGVGVPEMDAQVCAEVLITADRMGIDSHGVNRLKPTYYDRLQAGLQLPVTRMDVVRDGPTTAVVDGNRGMGHVIAKKAMQMSIDKAKQYGMGMVAVRNMLGTNPLTFAFPTDEEFPFLLDCATSITQRGKIEVKARKNELVPEGLVIGQDGDFMINAQEILDAMLAGEAALLPLGGAEEETGSHKGYGYSTVVEVLSSALQGGAFLKAITGVNVGHFFITVDISSFTEIESFKRTAGEIMRNLRASKKAPGCSRIYTPGEKEYETSMTRHGAPINRSLLAELHQMRDELGLTGYDF